VSPKSKSSTPGSSALYGYLMIIAVCVTTAGLTESTEITEAHFNYPFIVRYICMAAGMAGAIPLLICKLCIRNMQILRSGQKMYFYAWAFVGSMGLTAAGMIYFWSFDGISVPTATALGGTRAVMVLILSVFLIHEKVTLWKIMAVLVSVAGILCYVYEAKHKKKNSAGNGVDDTVWGCMLCLLANFMFAFCDVVAGKVSEAYAHKVMGSLYYQIFQGLYQLPLFLWVWYWPKTPDTEQHSEDWSNMWWCIFPVVALTLNNLSVFIGVTIKSPFYVNIGTLLGIPLAFVVDIFIHHYKPTLVPILGALLLIISFLMLEVIKPPKQLRWCNVAFINAGYDDDDEDLEKNKQRDKHAVDKEGEKDELVQPLIVNQQGSDSNLKEANDSLLGYSMPSNI